MERKILAIESATDWLSVAFLEGESLIEIRHTDARMQHASALLPAVDETLGAAGIGLDEVDAIAISTGPGSFTSLRIGLATVKGLAFRRDMETVGVSTLEAMALARLEKSGGADADAGQEKGEVLALLDARRGEWYAGSWAAGAGPEWLPESRLAEGLYSPRRIAASLEAGVHVVAAQPGGWLAALDEEGVGIRSRTEGDAARPSAEWVGKLGARRLQAGQGQPARALSARYLRRAEAEAKLLGGPVEKGEFADLGESMGGA